MPKAQTENEKKVEEYKERLKKSGEQLVKDVFPRKVLELDDLVNDPRFELSRTPEFSAADLNIPFPEALTSKENGDEENCVAPKKKIKIDPASENTVQGTKVLGFVGGTVPSNPLVVELADRVKPYVREAVDHVNTVKMWISFLIPRIEDGNNFGVSIQEDTLAEVRTVEVEAASFLDAISRYFINRGRLVTKIAKYPHVADYRRAVRDLDEKQFINLRLVVIELRNHYSTLHDVIMKNFEKIKKPRNSNAEHLY